MPEPGTGLWYRCGIYLVSIAIDPSRLLCDSSARQKLISCANIIILGRGPRDPAAPKSATSAQQFFNKARRELLRKKNPDISSADLQKKLAEEWRDLPPNKRAPYMRMASTDKERYVEESAGYVPDPAHLKATKGGKRFQKDPLRPKKPKSAYLYFGEATRAELSGANPGIRARTARMLRRPLLAACA